MIVTCPACSTRYTLPESKIGAEGRQIQCVKCQYSWFQTPASLPSKHEDTDAQVKAPIAPENTSAGDIPTLKKEGSPTLPKGSMALPQPVVVGGGLLLIGLMALLVVLLVANPLSPNMPDAYRALTVYEGERVAHQSGGLVLTDVDRKVVADGDVAVLIFTGKVSNTGTLPTHVPEIRVQLLDKRGVELDFWPAQVEKTELSPGESADWSVRFLDPDLARIAEYRAFIGEM